MDNTPQGSELLEGHVAAINRQLPSGSNKVERISQHTKGLVEDLTSWVELKIKLTQVEIEEKIDSRINQMVIGAIVAVLGLITLIFALITAALGLGAWLGHPAWGFLIVTGVLALITIILISVKPDLAQRKKRVAIIDEERLTPQTSQHLQRVSS